MISSIADPPQRCLEVHHQIFWAFVSMKNKQKNRPHNLQSRKYIIQTVLKVAHIWTYTKWRWRPWIKSFEQTISEERLPWKEMRKCLNSHSKETTVITCKFSEDTYWRVSQMIPVWTSLPRTDVFHPSPVHMPTEIIFHNKWQILAGFLI